MPEAIMVVDRHDFFSALESRDTTLATKVQRPLGFVYIKAVLGLRFAVNEKNQIRYTLPTTSKRSPHVCFKTTYQGKN